MKLLTTFAFGVFALVAANFATAAPAQADSFGLSVGRGGFGIYVNDYDGYYDRGYYGHRRGCWTRWDYRHKWYCRRHHRSSYYYDDYFPSYNSFYPYYSDYNYYPRYRNHFRHNRHWRNRDWRDRRHNRRWRRHDW